MATQTQPPPAKSVPAQPRRLPFRVLIVPRNGPVLVSQPLDELAARLLVNGALAGGDQAQMVENHRPRDRWAEAAFAASPLVEPVTLHSACSCGKCPPTQLTVRLARVPVEPPVAPVHGALHPVLDAMPILDARRKPSHGEGVSGERRVPTWAAACVTFAAGVGLALLVRELARLASQVLGDLAIGGAP